MKTACQLSKMAAAVIRLLSASNSRPNTTLRCRNTHQLCKNLLGKCLPVLKTWDELARAAEEVWNTQIMLEHIKPVTELMEHHMEQVLTKHGGPLKY